MKLSSVFRIFFILAIIIQLGSLLAEHYLVERYDRAASHELAQKQIQLVYEHHKDNLRGQLLVGNFEHAKEEFQRYAMENQLLITLIPAHEKLPKMESDDNKIAFQDFTLSSYGKDLAQIRIQKVIPSIFDRVKLITLFFLFSKLTLITSIFLLIYFALKRWILHPIEEIAANLKDDDVWSPKGFLPKEIVILGNKIRGALALQKEIIRNTEMTKIASQVAHDIRSPLEVLKGIKTDLNLLPEDSRHRIHMGINRIEEITYNLLKTHKQSNLQETKESSEELLSLLISVLTEKRIEFRNQPSTKIVERIGTYSYGLFSQVHRSSLKSIISNLINNGIESLGGASGKIVVSLYSKDDSNVIEVKDSGCGISLEASERIFSKGFTTKPEGNGIGLYHAMQDLAAVAGKIEFSTKEGEGTSFFITLPKSEPSKTFLRHLDIRPYDTIIILDDDLAFHEIWNTRLKGCIQKVEHVFSVDEMITKYKKLSSKILLLSDFELMNEGFDGIDIIEKFGHSAHSLLVTARNEEDAIQRRCAKSGIKLLPKSLVNYLKILTEDIPEQSIVLIDDDRLIIWNWKTYCQKKGLSFTGFSSVDQFLAESTQYSSKTLIFIDSNLGGDVKGEIESEKIFNLGFSNIYLATGYDKHYFEKPLWIKDIFSKSPENIYTAASNLQEHYETQP
jgi:signal transduction histidine kinase